MREWLGCGAAFVLVGLLGWQGAVAGTVTVEQPSQSGSVVTYGLYVSGFSLTAPPAMDFVVQVTLDIPANLDLRSGQAVPATATPLVAAALDDITAPSERFFPLVAGNMVGFSAFYKGTPQAFDFSQGGAARVLDLPFTLLSGAAPATITATVNQFSITDSSATIIPLPASLWLLGGALAVTGLFGRARRARVAVGG